MVERPQPRLQGALFLAQRVRDTGLGWFYILACPQTQRVFSETRTESVDTLVIYGLKLPKLKIKAQQN